MLLITLFIIFLNIIAVALIYHCLDNMENKDKIIFIGVSIAIIYMLTSFVYWISTKEIELKEVSETGKNLITFLFVPVNSIIVLPFFAKSYQKYKNVALSINTLKKRVIVLIVILCFILILECSYFKDIQNSVVKMIEESKKQQQEHTVVLDQNEIDPNLDLNTIADGEIIYHNEVE